MKNIHKSPWLLHYDGSSCNGCDIEVLACTTPVYDVERFGVVNTGNPLHADIFLITGGINSQNEEVVRQIYEQMPNPKVVVAVGTSACTGGIFKECYNIKGGVDTVIPVDIYVPGCAARPESIIDGVVQAVALFKEKHMKEIRDTEKLETVYQSQAHLFGKRPPFLRLLAYEKGELLNLPFQNLDQFLIVVEGNVVIYSLLEDGSIRHLFNSEHGILLGDIEYSGNTGKTLFIEAQEHVLVLSIPFAQNREMLDQDPVFLKTLIRSLSDKLSISSTLDGISGTLQEKVLVYMRQIKPDHRIISINHTLQILHCSRRQLQRVLADLSRQGIIIKQGRGQYVLSQNQIHPLHQ